MSTVLTIDPKPCFDLSPYLYMQFMEPLGSTDSSVEAGWDHLRDRWRPDLIRTTRKLAPTLIRWGGCFSSIYRWKEAVGPRSKRVPMLNSIWGGIESNQIGTHEFLDFCRQTGADPLLSVNFESDGRQHWAKPLKGGNRSGSPEEAAEWVDYCNNPSNKLRRSHGHTAPYNVNLWQIGNETSYDRRGYKLEKAAQRTAVFAKAMRKRDPAIQLIGWGDVHWGKRMLEVAGEHLNYLAFHDMFKPVAADPKSPLQGMDYRVDFARTWEHLMQVWKLIDARIRKARHNVAGYNIPLALTESHFAIPGRNRCEVLSTWAAGVSNACILNTHARHGDLLKIATLADFCGTRWLVNALIIPTPSGNTFMMPVARVMSLFRHHVGKKAVAISKFPSDLDITASRSGNRFFLHVVNTHRTRSVTTRLAISDHTIKTAKAFTIAADPELEIWQQNESVLEPKETAIENTTHTFPPASVTAIELTVASHSSSSLAASR